MNKLLITAASLLALTGSGLQAQTGNGTAKNAALATLVDRYAEDVFKRSPLSATAIGDNRYNHLLYIDFTDSFRNSRQQFVRQYASELQKFNRAQLNEKDRLNYDVLKRELDLDRERLSHPTHLLVFHQMSGLPATLALLGSGTGAQPFKTVADYDNWLSRASVFPAWTDSAIIYFRKGMRAGIVHPEVIVKKMIPQMMGLIAADPAKSVFYGPVAKMPADFSEGDKKRLTESYTRLITEKLNPSYTKLRDFLQNEYLPAARKTSGFSALPNGAKLYDFAIRNYTTTNMKAEAVFQLGLREVARIRKEMERVKREVGFTGDLKVFFEHMRTDPKFFPYTTQEEILDYYRAIQKRIDPTLARMFNRTPKTPFEVRAVEAFRAASAAAQYHAGSLENNRPGIFYVPIIDPKKTQTRESLFLHEAIPGHHYQIALTHENAELPKFRRYSSNSAYAEGWGLYAESLGKELGVYTDPYQYMLALGDEIHRAIRLVVDAGLHARGWTREQAIQYSLENEPIEEQRAISEVERYMAMPGQALSYKIGELKIRELRERYTKQLGAAFNLASFHDAILEDGSLPLNVLEAKMEAWAKRQKK